MKLCLSLLEKYIEGFVKENMGKELIPIKAEFIVHRQFTKGDSITLLLFNQNYFHIQLSFYTFFDSGIH